MKNERGSNYPGGFDAFEDNVIMDKLSRELHLETINDVVSTINKVLHLDKMGVQDEDGRDYNHRHLEMLKIDLSKLTSFVIHHTKDNRSQENEIKNLKSSMKSIEMIANNCLKIQIWESI